MSELHEDLDRVAIIGMAGRFPGAPDIETFWRNLEQGHEGIDSFSDEELVAAGVDPALLSQDNYVRSKGVIEDADRFDAGFFGYSPREAEIMDPQHRVFLECGWEALETAGCDPHTFDGRIGVFAGASLPTYLLFNMLANKRAYRSAGFYQTLLASDKDFLATRVSYKLGLKGPAITVQTACSTSLTAVHLATQSLLNGECDIALAGGVSVTSPLKNGYLHEQGGILAPDGHCRAFDADAGGTVASNGAGIVVLRRLEDARGNGDTVDAVIRGTAINNDGSLKAGYTAPSVDGQAEVISEALAVADVPAETVGYVEAHGTGTALGDPIEIAALTRAYREHTEDTGYCAIGSVKSNIGHLDAAAGVTALIKTALSLKHEAIPASLHFTRPNPELELESSPFFVNDELRPWPRQDTPRRAGVSSFGIGGTNVHVVLEEPPADEPADSEPAEPVLLPLSAKTPDAVAEGAQRLADYLDAHPEAGLGDVAHTLTHRRRAFGQRRAVAGRDREDVIAALRGVRPSDVAAAPENDAPVAFLFPGQGAQYVDMARDLYEHEPVFAEHVDRCAGLFAGHLGVDPRTLLFDVEDERAAAAQLEQTEITQPVLFLVEYALAQLWFSRGVRPRAMVGHSIGEYVAACLAGVFALEDAVRLVAARGRLVQAMPRGSMLTVFLPESEVAQWLGEDVGLAAVNSTALSVVSGPTEAIDALEKRLKAAAVSCRRLHTSHAFHSAGMDGAVEPLVEEVRTVTLNAPRIPFCSNVTGTWITDEQATSPEYWGSHLRRPVRFADAITELLGDPSLVMLEVGPGHTLGNFVRQHQAWDDTRTAVGSLRHPNEQLDDRVHLLRSFGALWSAGVPVDWAAVHDGADHRVLRLPTYAFQRQRYWVDPDPTAQDAEPAGTVRAASVDDWFYVPGWKRLPPQGEPGEQAGSPVDTLWVVLGDDLALGRDLARRLEDEGASVLRVSIGDELRQDGDTSWSLDPARREHYADLVKSLDARAPRATRFVHLFSLGCDPAEGLDEAQLDQARQAGFDSLLALAQGIGDVRPSAPIGIDVLCRGVHSVTGAERLQPENATLTGACTVIPQEVSGVGCRTLDITGADPHAPLEGTVRAVHAALTRPAGDRDLALRGRHWWSRDFDAVRLDAPDDRTTLRDEGVYLVTGGLGGVGLALAEHIARTVSGPVLGLLSRSEFPAEQDWDAWLDSHDARDDTSVRIRRLRELRECGARVVVLRADVTDPAQTSEAVERLRTEFGAVHGVVHAAGLPSNGMIAGKSRADADEVLAAKTRGTLVLDRVCGSAELDFFLLCSSVTSVLGGPGQSDYCAANAFLDTFAQWKRDNGAPVTAIAWDTWSGVGMAAGLAARFGAGESSGQPTGHPLLGDLVQETESTRVYRTSLNTAQSWIVDDHRIMGHGLVPGTAYLELVRAAAAEQAGGRAIELHDVLFSQPIIVPDGQTRELYTTIEAQDGGHRFTVRSKTGGGGSTRWQTHAVGAISWHDREPETVRDLDAVRTEIGATKVVEDDAELKSLFRLDLMEQGGQIEFTMGPRWHCLDKVHVGRDRLLTTIRLDDAFHADLDTYQLHPALFDVAGVSGRIQMRDGYYLPFSYGSLRIYAGLTSTIHCDVRLTGSGDSGETLTCDFEILSPDGRCLVRITGFTLKRIHDADAMIEQLEQATVAAQHGTDTADSAEGAAAPGTLRLLGEGMSEQDGRAAFARILAAEPMPGHLVVSSKDFTVMRRLARSITPASLAEELDGLAPQGGTHPRPDLDTPYVAPATDEEQAVAAIWQEVLGIAQIGVHDDFFALGGHSLAAVQIGTKIQGHFGVELDLREFFNAPTVANTVAVLAAGGSTAAGDDDAIEALSSEEDTELDELDDLSDDEVEAKLRELLAEEMEDQGDAT